MLALLRDALVLLGEFLPGIVLSPRFGSLADRISRRRLAVCADLLRGDLLHRARDRPLVCRPSRLLCSQGLGPRCSDRAINAALPGIVPPERRSQLTAMFYASINTGLMLGPAIAAGLLLVTTAPVVLVLNAISFVVSAVLLGSVDLGALVSVAGRGRWHESREAARVGVWADTRAGAQAALVLPGVPVRWSWPSVVPGASRCRQ